MVHKSKTNEKISRSFPRQCVERYGGKTQRVTNVFCFLLVWSVFFPGLLLNHLYMYESLQAYLNSALGFSFVNCRIFQDVKASA